MPQEQATNEPANASRGRGLPPKSRTTSTLRLFHHTVRKLVYFGPLKTTDSALLLSVNLIVFAVVHVFMVAVQVFSLRTSSTAQKHHNRWSPLGILEECWDALGNAYDTSQSVTLYMLLSVWLSFYMASSWFIATRYEAGEVRLADDVVMVNREDTEGIETSDGSKKFFKNPDDVFVIELPRISQGDEAGEAAPSFVLGHVRRERNPASNKGGAPAV